jgi:TolA-binding protein
MEDLYKKYGVTDDEERIQNLGKYADANSEVEWQYLKSYEEKNWDKFKKELINSYPQAADQERGSLKKLKRLCKENRGIDQTDLVELKSLVRRFVAEVSKLQKEPALLSNREAVEMFLDCLEPEFRNNVLSRLEVLSKVAEGTVRPEDRFQLEEVIETAISIGQGSRTAFRSVASRTAPATPSGRANNSEMSSKVEAEISRLKDSFNVQSKQSESGLKQLNNKIEELTRLMSQSRVHAQNVGGAAPRFGSQESRGGSTGGCFYCGDPEHMKNECPRKAEHLLKGWITVDAFGRVKMADGRPIPWGKMGDSVSERVELAYADGKAQVNVVTRQRTPGLIQLNQNMIPIGNSAQLNASGATQAELEDLLDQLDLNDVQQYVFGRVQYMTEQENF